MHKMIFFSRKPEKNLGLAEASQLVCSLYIRPPDKSA